MNILDLFHFYRVVNDAWAANDVVCQTATRALSSITKVDDHYTYTLPENDNENITPDDDEDKDIAPEDMIDISGDLGGMAEGVGP